MEPGFRKIIHPETGNIAEVPATSLAQHYRSGWAPLDESPEPEPEPVPDPAPVRAKKAAAAEGSGSDTKESE